MQTNDLPQAQKERAFVYGLYAALGLEPHPLRVLWDRVLTPHQKTKLLNDAAVPGVIWRRIESWDELAKHYREKIEATWQAQQRSAA